ncbi:hypothetical protein SAMN04488135_109157 [Pollutimonas bauzanensis]|uniref:Uncharacterized protein n=1 Tax=Pollutimonas bauzanensis TaxID=658167 RepID=A0A1M5YJV8_9BURK|nr:hypothetical protein SAMN04488135_109157 [Pollutimonas bauzanensis]
MEANEITTAYVIRVISLFSESFGQQNHDVQYQLIYFLKGWFKVSGPLDTGLSGGQSHGRHLREGY